MCQRKPEAAHLPPDVRIPFGAKQGIWDPSTQYYLSTMVPAVTWLCLWTSMDVFCMDKLWETIYYYIKNTNLTCATRTHVARTHAHTNPYGKSHPCTVATTFMQEGSSPPDDNVFSIFPNTVHILYLIRSSDSIMKWHDINKQSLEWRLKPEPAWPRVEACRILCQLVNASFRMTPSEKYSCRVHCHNRVLIIAFYKCLMDSKLGQSHPGQVP